MRPRSHTLAVLEKLYRLAREADQASPIAAHEVTHRELNILDAIERGVDTFRQLAALDGVSNNAIRMVIERLEQHKFARRIRIVGKRGHEVEITTTGREVIEARRDFDASTRRYLQKRLGESFTDVLSSIESLLVARGLLEESPESFAAPEPVRVEAPRESNKRKRSNGIAKEEHRETKRA